MKWLAISLVLLALFCMPIKSQNDTSTTTTGPTTESPTTPVPTYSNNSTNTTTSDTESLLAAVKEKYLKKQNSFFVFE